ncbi:MAG TPA: hypothetical protein VKY89_19315 [Thermoanaerobaculia bacterium]|jgi:hypothetical protein|nr:hypothetical protein [Thermoanaerobaculia bacterium]
MDDHRKTLTYALEKYPESVELLPLQELVLESARQNPKRPAYVKLAVPDEMVKSLKGAARADQDLVLVVRVPREVMRRSESRIILPGEVS